VPLMLKIHSDGHQTFTSCQMSSMFASTIPV